MLYLLPRARFPIRAFNKLAFHRAHHSATGKFITISPHATPVAREIEVWLGDLGNAYVMLGPEISQNFQTATMLQGGCSLAQDQELFPLTFHHGTRHFSHNSSPYPRFEIPQDLPQQSNAHSSPATFHAYGVTHAIMLDGTPDAEFQNSIRDSIQLLQPVLNELKDTWNNLNSNYLMGSSCHTSWAPKCHGAHLSQATLRASFLLSHGISICA